MARPAATSVRQTEFDGGMIMVLLTLVVGIVSELDTLYAKLNADAGVTDTNYDTVCATHASISTYK